MNLKNPVDNFLYIVTQRYFCFDGRASRKEYWMFVLAAFAISFILNLIPGIGRTLSGIWNLALLCPYIGINARRLHDTGKSGWLQLLALIPIIGAFIVLFFYIQKGDKETNVYGVPEEY